QLIRLERNRRDDSMSAAAILFAKFRQILPMWTFRPWIRANGHLGADGRLADANAVDALWEQVVGDEFVVAVQVMVTHVEFDYAVDTLGHPLHDLDRFEVVCMESFKHRAYLGNFDDIGQGLVLNLANDLVYEFGIMARLDDEHQFHRRVFEFHCSLCISKLCAIDDIGTVYKVFEFRHRT